MTRHLRLVGADERRPTTRPDDQPPPALTAVEAFASEGRRRPACIETITIAEHPELIYLKLHMDDGIVGLGEAYGGAAAIESYLHDVAAPRLLTADAATLVDTIRSLFLEAKASRAPAHRRGASAIDLAFWDAVGQAAGLPLHEVLGGACRDRIRIYSSLPTQGASTRAARPAVARASSRRRSLALRSLPDLAEALVDNEITAMKVAPFDFGPQNSAAAQSMSAADLDRALKPLKEIRARLGHRIDLLLEFRSQWDLPTAKRIARAVEELNPYWIEEPMRADDLRAIAAYARAVRVPITLREPLTSDYAFHDLLNRRIAGIIMFSLGWSGGISGVIPVAALADAFSLPLTLYGRVGPVLLSAATHIAVSAPNALIQETVQEYYTQWYGNIVTELPSTSAGTIGPPPGPGIGTALLPDIAIRNQVHTRSSAR
jgi:L-alanine-DL-glutamate epimerase-like enolase superfamily enzyme